MAFGTATDANGYMIKKVGDLDTGVGSSAANTVDIYCGGSSVAAFTSAGLSATVTGAVDFTTLNGDIGTGTCSSDAVTISKNVGKITTEAKSTAAGGTYTITVTNTRVAATSLIFCSVSPVAGAGTPVVASVIPGSGSFTVTVQNIHASAAFDSAHKIDFLVVNA